MSAGRTPLHHHPFILGDGCFNRMVNVGKGGAKSADKSNGKGCVNKELVDNRQLACIPHFIKEAL